MKETQAKDDAAVTCPPGHKETCPLTTSRLPRSVHIGRDAKSDPEKMEPGPILMHAQLSACSVNSSVATMGFSRIGLVRFSRRVRPHPHWTRQVTQYHVHKWDLAPFICVASCIASSVDGASFSWLQGPRRIGHIQDRRPKRLFNQNLVRIQV